MRKKGLNLFVAIFAAMLSIGCSKDTPTPALLSILSAEVIGDCVIKTEVNEPKSLITYYVPSYTPESEFKKCGFAVNFNNGTIAEESKKIDLLNEETTIVAIGNKGETKKYTLKRELVNVSNMVGKVAGKYKGNMIVEVNDKEENMPEQVVTVSYAGHNVVNVEIKNFIFNGVNIGTITAKNIFIYLKNNDLYNIFCGYATQTIKIGTESVPVVFDVMGLCAKNKMKLTIDIEGVSGMDIEVQYVGDIYAEPTDNTPLFASVSGAKVLSQKFSTTTLTYYGDKDNTPQDYADLKLDIKIPIGATLEGVENLDFTQESQKVTIRSASGATRTFTIKRSALDLSGVTGVDFTDWAEKTQTAPKKSYFDPVGWTTPNSALIMIMTAGLYPNDGEYPVSPYEQGKIGKGAKLMTLDTKGGPILASIEAPKVTAGTIYTGKFNMIAAISNPLNATEFGLPYSGAKPLALKGWYKYTPGIVYYDDKTVVENKIDEPSVSVVIYDVTDNVDAKLTGVDLYTSSRVIAVGMINPAKSDDFKEFNVPITYKRAYDPTKNVYKLAIVLSASKDGAAFKGAPGSTFIVDEIEMVLE